MDETMIDWFVQTLRTYPEIAIFQSLALGYYFGSFTNTIGVYSYSKYFGCTGWRLGVIAIHEDNIFDKMIAKLPKDCVDALDKRYGPITLEPRKLKFIDRIVADSRDIGLNHTAGLSLPQQVMMTMFSLCELMDADKAYQKACMNIVQRRAIALIEGLGLQVRPMPILMPITASSTSSSGRARTSATIRSII
jgi:aspartate/methionine/tyrosine aminotransferase